jgi:hypothetical protein
MFAFPPRSEDPFPLKLKARDPEVYRKILEEARHLRKVCFCSWFPWLLRYQGG